MTTGGGGKSNPVPMQVYSEEPGQAILWNASLVLLKHLEEKRKDEFAGKKVLELGAGRGTLSVGMARLGAHVTSTEAPCQRPDEADCGCWGCARQLRKGIATTLGSDQDSTAQGVKIEVQSGSGGAGEGGSVRVEQLGWGEVSYSKPGTLRSVQDGGEKYDIIIMSECIYNQSGDSLYDDEFHDNLVWTLVRFATEPGCVAYNIFVDRPFSFMFFAKIDELEGSPFQVKQLADEDFDNMGLTEEDARVYMHRIVKK